jgi:hypothetical protein
MTTWVPDFKNMSEGEIIYHIIYGLIALIPLIMLIIYASKRAIQNSLFKKSKIEGFHVSIRHFDSKDEPPIIELIRIRSKIIKIIGDNVYFFKDQKYQLNLKFSKQHSSVINGTWKNMNDQYHYGEFAWNFNLDTNESNGFWSGTRSDGAIEFGGWELKKLDKEAESILNDRFFKNKFRIFFSKLFQKKSPPLYNDILENILRKHKTEPEKPFEFNDRRYDIMKNVFNPQFGKIGRPLIEYLLEKYDLSKYNNILDWGTGCGYYCIEIALKQIELKKEPKIVALESNKDTRHCATKNIMKFLHTEKIKLTGDNRISNTEFNTKFDLIIANMPFSQPCHLVKYKKHPMYHCFCCGPELLLEICFEIKNALSINGIALLSFADSGDQDLLFKCVHLLDMTIEELFIIDKEHGATDDVFYAYEIKNQDPV